MSRVSQIRRKEVINLRDGSRLGYVSDVEIDEHSGKVEAIIVPAPIGIFGLFGRAEDYIISWDEIEKIGEDLILVSVDLPHSSYRPERIRRKSRRYTWYT